MTTEIQVSKRFERKNEEVRVYYINYREAEDDLRQKINELAIIVHEEDPNWSLTKIFNFICVVNQDIDGFSKSHVNKNLTDENRIILDVKKTKLQRALPSESLEEFRQQKGKQVVTPEEEGGGEGEEGGTGQ